MMPRAGRIKMLSIVLLVGLVTTFCAPKDFLVVNYRLPAETVTIEEPTVALILQDNRADPIIATKSAKMALKDFSGNFALIVASQNKNERLVGAFSLCSMIRAIFKQRLENAGIRVVSKDQYQQSAVEIILEKFKLDLAERKWVVHMAYQANLVRQNRFVAGQRVTGSAERLRVVGRKDAEAVIGELITDAVNRLNLTELFQAEGA